MQMAIQAFDIRSTFIQSIISLLTMIPFAAFFILYLNACPTVESWLTVKTNGYFRPDAFDSVNGITPVFTFCFGVTSFIAACLIFSNKSQFLLPLIFGPAIGMASYLVPSGFSDPSFFLLMACLSIGMLVGSSVTGLWVIADAGRVQLLHATKPATEDPK